MNGHEEILLWREFHELPRIEMPGKISVSSRNSRKKTHPAKSKSEQLMK
jgi:hypothetical protein